MTPDGEVGIEYAKQLADRNTSLAWDRERLLKETLSEIAKCLGANAQAFNCFPDTRSQAIIVEQSPSAVILRDAIGNGLVIAAYVESELRILNACRVGPSEMLRFIPEWTTTSVSFSDHDSNDQTSVEELSRNMFDSLLKSEAYTEEE